MPIEAGTWTFILPTERRNWMLATQKLQTLSVPPFSLFSDAYALKASRPPSGWSSFDLAYTILNVATDGVMSIRPLHKFVNWSLYCWALGDWLAQSCLLQASNYTRLFYYLVAPLTPLARYFQPIHFYNLFFPREQTRRKSSRFLQSASHAAKCELFDGAMQFSCFSERGMLYSRCYTASKQVSVPASAYGRQVLRKRRVTAHHIF